MVLKTIRDCNAQNNLRLVQSGLFERPRTVGELDALNSEVQNVIYTSPRSHESLALLMNALGDNKTVAAYEVIRVAIFAEYFDNRRYLMELYLDFVKQTVEREVHRTDLSTERVIKQYLWLIAKESEYFQS